MAWRQFLSRSVQQVKDETARVMRASPIEPHGNIRSLPLASFVPPPASPSSSNVEAAKAEIRNWATGADGDIGGMSWCRLEPYSPAAAATSSASASGIASGSMSQAPATEASGSTSSSTAASPALRRNLQQELDSIPNLDSEAGARFYGNLSSQVRQGMKLGGSKVDRSGYAGIRTKTRNSLFGTLTWDTSSFTYLKIRCKPSADEGMRYFVNIQTDGPVRSDLFQHRLWLPPPSSDWQTVLVPLSDFTLTNTGTLSETQIEMFREKVRTIGISVLGPGEGDFELGLQSFECVNVEGEERDELEEGRRKQMLGAGGEAEVAYLMSREKARL